MAKPVHRERGAGPAVRIAAMAVMVLLGLLAGGASAQQSGGSATSFFFPGEREAPPPKPLPRARSAAAGARGSNPVKDEVADEAAILPKRADARLVLVVGDFVAAAAAEGLDAVFAADRAIAVANRSNGSSGLVRADYFDWPAAMDALLDAEKPSAVVVVLGANDRQPMAVGGARVALRSEAWTLEYSSRAAGLARTVTERHIPLIWLGAPPFRSARTTSDLLAFNELYRRVAADSGGLYIDVWDGFVDQGGAYVASGPDVEGQPVRLRGDDGVSLTAAGKRKLAFYAEGPLRKLLDAAGSDALATPKAPVPDAAVAPEIPSRREASGQDRTAPISLNETFTESGFNLLGNPVVIRQAARGDGDLPPAVPGRADDFTDPPARPSRAP